MKDETYYKDRLLAGRDPGLVKLERAADALDDFKRDKNMFNIFRKEMLNAGYDTKYIVKIKNDLDKILNR